MMKLAGLSFVTALALAAAPSGAQTGIQTDGKPGLDGAALPVQVATSGPAAPTRQVAAPAPAGSSALMGAGPLMNMDAMLGIHRRKQ